jgi:hypothetical protein
MLIRGDAMVVVVLCCFMGGGLSVALFGFLKD